MRSVRDHSHSPSRQIDNRIIGSCRLEIDERDQRLHLSDRRRCNPLEAVAGARGCGLERTVIHEIRGDRQQQRQTASIIHSPRICSIRLPKECPPIGGRRTLGRQVRASLRPPLSTIMQPTDQRETQCAD